MLFEEYKTLISISGIPEAFNFSSETFIIFFLSSIIIGFICLTLYYKIYDTNPRWERLDYLDKMTISLVVGFFSILISFFLIGILDYIYQKNFTNELNTVRKILFQLLYLFPFIYFISISSFTKIDYYNLDFIKDYINKSMICLIIFLLLFLIILSIYGKNYFNLLVYFY